MLGQHKRNIAIVPYQDSWLGHFKAEAKNLRIAMGDHALGIKHIGSTSIINMAAKPVIDMMIAVESLPQAEGLIPLLEDLGYIYRPNDTVPGRMFFAKECSPEIRTHHLNLTEVGSSFWVNQLAFRDYLWTNDTVAAEYVQLKLRLAEEYVRTGEIDLEGKTEFVARVLELARMERQSPANINNSSINP